MGWKKNFMNAISKASGDLIFLSDQDDIWYLDKIEKMAGITKKEQEKRSRKKELDRRIQEFREKADELGIADDLIFATTFDRYVTQVQTLADLKEEIEEGDLMVKKAYVKDRDNLYVNPAVAEYNKTSTAANQTAVTLVKLMQQLRDDAQEDDGFDDLFGSKGR